MDTLVVNRSFDTLLLDAANGVLTLTLNRPERSNAIDQATWAALTQTLRDAGENPSIRAVVLAGAGKNFCAGADLSPSGTEAAAEQSHLRFMRAVGETVRTLHHLPVPTVAKVHGAAFGAGWNLALACDLVVATDDARFCQVFARRGLAVDSGASWLLPRLIGLQRAKELALLGTEVSASDAHALGLVTRLAPPDQIDAVVDDVARQLVAGAPMALSLTKSMLNASHGATLDEALEGEARAQSVVLASADGAEALAAFVEKRPPQFVGR